MFNLSFHNWQITIVKNFKNIFKINLKKKIIFKNIVPPGHTYKSTCYWQIWNGHRSGENFVGSCFIIYETKY